MKHTFLLSLLIILCMLSSCNSSTTTAKEDAGQKDQTHGAHNMAMMESMDDMMQRTNAMKMTGDFDVDFANMMIEHHQGDIDMSEIQVKSGSDAELKDMAKQIIVAQKAEIVKLRDFVQAHPATAIQQQPMHSGSMQSMHDQMKSMSMNGNMDQDFASMMMMHHEGAVTMAKEELANGQHTELKQMAQQMIDDQQREIANFQAWLDKNRK